MTDCPEYRQGRFAARLLDDGSIELTRVGLVGRCRSARDILWQRSQVETALELASRRRGRDAADYTAVLRWAHQQMAAATRKMNPTG